MSSPPTWSSYSVGSETLTRCQRSSENENKFFGLFLLVSLQTKLELEERRMHDASCVIISAVVMRRCFNVDYSDKGEKRREEIKQLCVRSCSCLQWDDKGDRQCALVQQTDECLRKKLLLHFMSFCWFCPMFLVVLNGAWFQSQTVRRERSTSKRSMKALRDN